MYSERRCFGSFEITKREQLSTKARGDDAGERPELGGVEVAEGPDHDQAEG